MNQHPQPLPRCPDHPVPSYPVRNAGNALPSPTSDAPIPRSTSAGRTTIDLPAEVEGNAFIVRINGIPVHATLAPMKIVLTLVQARLRTASGLTPPTRKREERQSLQQTISRLRAAIDRALGKGAGKQIVQLARAAGSRYRLPEGVLITADPALKEFVPPLPQHLVEDIVTCLSSSPPDR